MIAKNMYDPRFYVRPTFKDCTRHDVIFDDAGWIVELKQDGIWGIGTVVDGNLTIYNTTYETAKGHLLVDPELSCVLAGEYMFGSNWAARHGTVGQYVVYDILSYQGEDQRGKPFHARRRLLEQVYHKHLKSNEQIKLSTIWPIQAVDLLWDKFVVGEDYEGLVFKYDTDDYYRCTWYRQKLQFSADYVCTGFDEGQGKNKAQVKTSR